MSCKGVNKSNIKNPMNIFEKVLSKKKSEEVENKGIRTINRQTFSYRQFKTGFSYFYCKRKVLADGIHTEPLDIVLSPYSE